MNDSTMDFEAQIKGIAKQHGIAESELAAALPHPAWVAIHGLTVKQILELAELVAADLLKRKVFDKSKHLGE